MNLKRYFTIYAALWKNSVAREMSFKGNFILWIIVELLWFGLQLSFVSVIYSQTSSIGSWTKWQMVLLVGASNFIQQIYQAFFLTNCTGAFGTRPHGQDGFSARCCRSTRASSSHAAGGPGRVRQCAVRRLRDDFCGGEIGFASDVLAIVGFSALCGVGIFIHYTLMFMLASISFWTVRAQGIVWGYYNLFNIARMPDEVFRGAFKAVFTFALPILLVSNVPVRVLADKITSPESLLLLLGLGLIWTLISEWFWRFSLSRYTSAST